MRGSANGGRHGPARSHRDGSSNTITTASSYNTNPASRTDENSAPPSEASPRSERWNDACARPSWLPHAMWSHVTDARAGDTPRERRRRNQAALSPKKIETTYTVAERAPLTPQNGHNGFIDDRAGSEETDSTYESHLDVTRKPAPHRQTMVKFDHWINEQPVLESTNRSLSYLTTQLIRQTTNDVEKKVVWIYSYKNRHLFTEDCNGVDSGSPQTEPESEIAEPDNPCTVQSDHRQDKSCDSWSCYDTKLKGSPRYPNTCQPVYIPSLKLAATQFSLETVPEAVETDKSETGALSKRHISEETIRSVKRWIDGSVHDIDSSAPPPDEIFEEQVLDLDEIHQEKELDVSKTGFKLKPPRIRLDTFHVRNDNIHSDDWITEQKRTELSSGKTSMPTERRLCDMANAGNAVFHNDASARLHARAMRMFHPSPWELYYPFDSPRASEVHDISLSRSAMSEKGRFWAAMSRCFCKCFACRK